MLDINNKSARSNNVQTSYELNKKIVDLLGKYNAEYFSKELGIKLDTPFHQIVRTSPNKNLVNSKLSISFLLNPDVEISDASNEGSLMGSED